MINGFQAFVRHVTLSYIHICGLCDNDIDGTIHFVRHSYGAVFFWTFSFVANIDLGGSFTWSSHLFSIQIKTKKHSLMCMYVQTWITLYGVDYLSPPLYTFMIMISTLNILCYLVDHNISSNQRKYVINRQRKYERKRCSQDYACYALASALTVDFIDGYQIFRNCNDL